MKPPVAYQDPDQTPLKTGYEAQMLREMWSTGMDLPQGMHRPGGMPHLSKLFMACFLGRFLHFSSTLLQIKSTLVCLRKNLKNKEKREISDIFLLEQIGFGILKREGVTTDYMYQPFYEILIFM